MKNLKQRKVASILCVIAAMVLVLAITATAATYVTKTIKAQFGVKITLNNEPFQPTDASGKAVEAMMVDGTTYLPVRAVAEATGATVQWDAETGTVKLYTAGNGAWTAVDNDFVRNHTISTSRYDYSSDKAALLKNSGKPYQNGFLYTGAQFGNLMFMGQILMDTDKTYTEIQFDLSLLNTESDSDLLTLKISESQGDIVYKVCDVTVGTQTITADISGAECIRIELVDNNGSNSLAKARQITLGDMKLR